MLGAHRAVAFSMSSMLCDNSAFGFQGIRVKNETDKSTTYQVFLDIFNLCVPEKDDEPSDGVPRFQDLFRNKIVENKRHDLGETLEMLADQTTLVFADVFSIDCCDIETLSVQGC